MNKFVIWTGMSIGGSIGWWLGSMVGIMTAFVLSVVGTAFGLYAARRLFANYLL